MTCSPDEVGIEGRLRTLMERGFRFMHPRSASGAVDAVVGFRTHHGVVDVVAFRAEEHAKASRVRADEPNVLSPSETLWQTRGVAADVVDELLALPDGAAEGGAAGAARGCWLSTSEGRRSWVAAS